MSRRTSGRAVIVLRQGYKDAARAGDWQSCKKLADKTSLPLRDLYEAAMRAFEQV